MNGSNNLRVVNIPLGSVSSDTLLPVLYAKEKMKLHSVAIMNGAAIAAGEGNYVSGSLRNGSTVLAEIDTRAAHENGLAQNVAEELNLVSGQEEIESGVSLTFYYDEQDGFAEVSEITCVADASDSLDGTYFVIGDDAGTVGVWIDTDDSGTAEPSHGADRGLEVTTIATDDDAATVATKIAAVLHADSKFSASATDEVITVTSASIGTRTDVVDGDTGFSFEVTQQGFAGSSVALTNAQLSIAFECIGGE